MDKCRKNIDSKICYHRKRSQTVTDASQIQYHIQKIENFKKEREQLKLQQKENKMYKVEMPEQKRQYLRDYCRIYRQKGKIPEEELQKQLDQVRKGKLVKSEVQTDQEIQKEAVPVVQKIYKTNLTEEQREKQRVYQREYLAKKKLAAQQEHEQEQSTDNIQKSFENHKSPLKEE